VELCLVSLGMAPENGSTGHHSYFTLAEGEDAKMETAEVSESPKMNNHKTECVGEGRY
jgi:hypothetical protein